ncbi:MAG: alcohol dehydrogenase [Spartobacteria bacterium]|nr:alcohol dehydrogenase [Spartobacteria bacterium]
MKALVFDRELYLDPHYPDPEPLPGWAMIRVDMAGICRTDLELTRGYMGFKGVPGHEFVGTVTDCDEAPWIGRRVVCEINNACGKCDWCARGLGRHCPHRSVLGILNHDGCMAEYCTAPVVNLLPVPDDIPNEKAVFIEPLSAAYEILEQVEVGRNDRCVVLGDGKLGILCAWVLTTVSDSVILVGHHATNLAVAAWDGLETTGDVQTVPQGADIVVEATGSPQGLQDAIALCRPRGTLVLKSTLAAGGALNLAPVVVNELTLIGSRCGLFARGLQGMVAHAFPVERMIAARFPLDQAVQAFAEATRPGALKILLEMA